MDYSRQLGLFDPRDFAGKSVSIIGAGATGSHVALQLAMMGIGNTLANHGKMRVFDFDVVEEHNLANQAFYPRHIKMPKVEALKDIIKEKCGFEIEVHNEKVTDQKKVLGTYVFLLTDTMSSRKEIFEKCLKNSINTERVIETRMGVDEGKVFSFAPYDQAQYEKWCSSLYSDEEATASPCGMSESIIPTVNYISSMAVWTFLHHFDQKFGGNKRVKRGRLETPLIESVTFSLAPFMIV